MEGIDKAREQEIWQRVQEHRGYAPPGEDLYGLILAEAQSAAVYRHLLSSGKNRTILQQLLSHSAENIACLKGILALQHLGGGNFASPSVPKGTTAQLLEGCYHRSRRCLMEYTARSAQPDYGVLFHQLANKQETQLCRIVELLGR